MVRFHLLHAKHACQAACHARHAGSSRYSKLIKTSIKGDESKNIPLLFLDREVLMFIKILNFICSSKIDQSEIPINTVTISFPAVEGPLERVVTKRTMLNENITFGDGAVDPACIMKSENESSGFAPMAQSGEFFLFGGIEKKFTDRLE